MIASVYALGYHEKIENRPNTPPFLVEIRQTAFARIYSADKNVSLFLGRPPRMTKRFTCFQIPSGRTNLEEHATISRDENGHQEWDSDAKVNYRAETRWSALCASVKEDILELNFRSNRPSHQGEVA